MNKHSTYKIKPSNWTSKQKQYAFTVRYSPICNSDFDFAILSSNPIRYGVKP